ncbi:MAG: TauD/TfdA family dioxygenase, partial [Acidimicrobiales bacterium]
MSVTTQQITPEIGLEVTGLAGHELVDPARAAECQAALDAHGVVVYREAGIGDADLLAFTEMLGTVVIPKMGGLEEHPGVDVISLDPAESSLAKFRRSTIFWHLDGTTDELPQKATLLTALVVADEGGDTEFAHTYAAYAALPEDEKARLADLRVEHSLAAAQLMFTPEPTEKQRAAWDQVPSRV